jgi:hypothetical protein
MKNKHFQKRLAQLKLNKNIRGQQLTQGFRIYHCYDYREPGDKSWWDDTSFHMHGYRVVVLWIHPRYEFSNRVEDAAYTLVPLPANGTSDSFREYVAMLNLSERSIRVTTDIVVTPFLSVTLEGYAKHMTLCCPIEVHSEADVIKLGKFARALYKREVTLQEVFPGYKFDKDTE